MKYEWACPFCQESSRGSVIIRVAKEALGHLNINHGIDTEHLDSSLNIEKMGI
jgi:hypothetical protein